MNLQHMQTHTEAADNLQHTLDDISPQDQPLFTAGLAEMWTWTSETSTPSGLLRRDPVWATAPEMKVYLSDLRQAYSAFAQVESSVMRTIAQLSSGDSAQGMGDVSGTLTELVEQGWPERLHRAGKHL